MGESDYNLQALLDRFLAALRELPGAAADILSLDASVSGKHPADAEVELTLGGRTLVLLVEIKKRVFPRDVQSAIWQLRAMTQGSRTKQNPVLIADSLSPGAKELLRAEQIGYFDSGGSMYLSAAGAYVYIDKPPPKSWEKAVRSLFSGKRAQVLHVLLANHREWLGVKALAERAQVAASTASEVFTELERFDWVEARGQGPAKERQLREPGKLLDAWVRQLEAEPPPNLRRYFVPGLKTDALMPGLGELFAARGVQYAMTHEAAAQRYAPYLSVVTQVRARVAPRSKIDGVLKELGAHEVDGGSNLAIIEAKSDGELLLRHEDAGVWFATPVQVYLDLIRSEGRSRDMAAHLREERIRF
jgi:hypothetical protein